MSDKNGKVRLTEAQIRAIETIVSGGERAEIIPARDGVKILRLRLVDVKPEP